MPPRSVLASYMVACFSVSLICCSSFTALFSSSIANLAASIASSALSAAASSSSCSVGRLAIAFAPVLVPGLLSGHLPRRGAKSLLSHPEGRNVVEQREALDAARCPPKLGLPGSCRAPGRSSVALVIFALPEVG